MVKNYIHISIDAEETCDKFQHSIMRKKEKTLNNLGIQRELPQLDKEHL